MCGDAMEARKGDWISQGWSYRIQMQSSNRAAKGLNH